MKKIIIEISDSQHEEMRSFLEKCFSTSIQEESMDDYSLKLSVSPLGSELEVEMYGKIELGHVNWKIEK
jgi:hypothetical protein